MKNIKKIFEKDGFYLALFACVCIIAVGGIWFTNSNVNKLADKELDKEIEIVNDDTEKNDSEAANAEAGKTLEEEKAEKEKQEAKKEEAKNVATIDEKVKSFFGKNANALTSSAEKRGDGTLGKLYIDTDGSMTYKPVNETVVELKEGTKVKSLVDGEVKAIEGSSITIKFDKNKTVTYEGLDKFDVVQGDKVEYGKVLGVSTSELPVSNFEGELGAKLTIKASQGDKAIDPDTLMK